MKKLLPKFYKALSAVTFVVASICVASWTLIITQQPECPEEIVR